MIIYQVQSYFTHSRNVLNNQEPVVKSSDVVHISNTLFSGVGFLGFLCMKNKKIFCSAKDSHIFQTKEKLFDKVGGIYLAS